VVEGVGPEFKPQNHKRKKTKLEKVNKKISSRCFHFDLFNLLRSLN
jgi:hypothetical protein